MISSMTGFGSAEGKVGSVRVSIELRTVNHRFFNPSIKLPGAFTKWEGDVRELLRQRIARGHVALTARIDREAAAGAGINEERFAKYVGVLRSLQERYGLSGVLDAATVLLSAGRGRRAGPRRRRRHGRRAACRRQTRHCGAPSDAVGRRRSALRVSAARGWIWSQRRSTESPSGLRFVLPNMAARLRKSVRELAGANNVDPQRLAQEVAILADRMDISEEIDRFRAHIERSVQDARSESGERSGRETTRFLLQEMVREANTMGSKASDAPILSDVVGIKEELERIREQVENVE